MAHLVLLGDSIFDNASYVPGGLAMIEHLRRCLPSGWQATLLARDGSVADGVAAQFERLPTAATHLVISTGGNDALDHSALILHESARSYAEVMNALAVIQASFRQSYRRMLQQALGRGLPTLVCTIYDAIPGLEPSLAAGLSLFNDVILREAFRARLPVLDLRLVCTEAGDYSDISPIEPSTAGGRKIAEAIGRIVAGSELSMESSRVFA